MIPQRKGKASRQAHVDLPEGTCEEEHGRQAFTGRASHLYRTAPPTAWVKVEGPLRPWAFDWNQLTPPDQTDPEGDPLLVLSNEDLAVLVSRRSAPMPYFVRDADGDVVYFVHRGEGTLETDYGPLAFRPGDYLVVPKGTTHRAVPATQLSKERFNNALFANMIMLGALTRLAEMDYEAMKKAMLEVIPRFHEQNLAAMDVGHALPAVLTPA